MEIKPESDDNEPDKEGTQNNPSEGDGGLSSSGKPSSDKNEWTQNKPSESSVRIAAQAGADKQNKPDGDSLRASSNDKALMEK